MKEEKVFHWALAGVLIPIVSLPLVLGAAMWARRRAQITGSQIWSRRLFALAWLDSAVAVALVALLWFVPSPAEVGPVEIGPPPAGETRPGAEGLFVPRHAMDADTCLDSVLPVFEYDVSWVWILVASILVLAAGWRGRRHGALRFLGAGAGVFLITGVVGNAVRAGGCVLCGGYAPGILLLGLLGHGVALAIGGALLARSQVPAKPLLGPRLASLQVYARSLYYAFVWVPRAAIVTWGLIGAVSLFAQTHGPLQLFTESELGVGGAALLLLAGAVVGPIAEELLFRGALLPWLARFLSPWQAIVFQGLLFGVLHVNHGISIVGPLVLGIILGWARARSGSLKVPILLHVTFNTASLTMLVLIAG